MMWIFAALRYFTPAICACLLMSSLVRAQGDESVVVHGFGTLAATRTDEPTAAYRAYPQANGEADKWAYDADSLLGLQMDIAPRSDLSATIQVIGRRRETALWDTQFEWAFIKGQIDPNWSVRVGRVLTPYFMDSENRFGGYANTFVRPDLSTYPIAIFSNHDGLDLQYQNRLGEGIVNLSGFIGTTSLALPPIGSKSLRVETGLAGIAAVWEQDNFMVRASHIVTDKAHVAGDGESTFRAIQSGVSIASGLGCPSCALAASRVDSTFSDLGIAYTDLGFRYTHNDWTTWGEYIRGMGNNKSLVGSSDGYSLGVSRAFGAWTPYIVGSRLNSLFEDSDVEIPASEIAAVPSAALRAALNAFNALRQRHNSRSSVAIGTRWDVAKNMALKAEVLHVELDKATANPNNFPAFLPAGGLRDPVFNVYSVTLDFFF